MDNIAGKRGHLTWALNIAVFVLVLLWTIPTVGLLVSSFRDAQQIQTSGWWTSLTPQQESWAARTGPPNTAIQADGTYVLEGNVFGDAAGEVVAFGISPMAPSAFPAGETAERQDGGTLAVNADGTYRLTQTLPFDAPDVVAGETATDAPPRGIRVFVTSTEPPDFTTGNYGTVLSAEGMGQSFLNTLTVSIPATVIPILVAAYAAYALAWMTFPGRALLVSAVVGLLVVPLQLSLIPLLQLHNGIGLGRGYIGAWLAHTGFGLPLAIYLLRNYMVGLPREVIESARVDGATDFEIFRKIILPLSLPALAAFGIFQFLWTWNDLLVAKVFLGTSDTQMVMTGRIVELLGSRGNNWELLTAAAFISMIVPLVVFFSLQKYFVRGLLAGSVKGG
ncbi:carbohydrate ABC transporter permease [Falsirhodobacter halotolerans]|uniref:carbohydrate ABC transporter permease n=1 Tax=Falsirhodobacter halotolerans TaxID=1146892 RepID=UPI001FCF81B2|nr:carbohydrate ABC transporter permease [Falsirhodobacter halotolerans]MCJ8141031.1 carbohydrate ABC transporter permease [Falsirhodobacter halotolerans]